MKKFTAILAAVLATALLLASCSGGGGAVSSGAASSTDSSGAAGSVSSGATSSGGGSQGNTVEVIVNDKGTFFSTDVWKAVPMVNNDMLNTGYTGGEGCQWPSWITFDPIDGKLAFMGTDTGGVFRSTDGGVTWEPSTLGLDTRGAVFMACDPNNTGRVALVGSVADRSGIFFSTDGGVTWERNYKTYLSRSHDYRSQVVFDETTYDKSIGGSKVLYWLRATEDADKVSKYNLKLGLYKSQDGGKNWSHIAGTEQYAGGWMEIDVKGNLYISNTDGIFKSTNGGKSFSCIFDEMAVSSLDIVRTKGYENYVYALTKEGLYLSKNSGGSFSLVTTSVQYIAPRYFRYLEVSPADPSRMVMQRESISMSGEQTYYSHDGGKTWHFAEIDTTTNVWAPYHPRQRIFGFHPTNANIVITFGGDSIYRSVDGGKSYHMSSEGYNGIYVAAPVVPNVNNPNLVAISAQDYNGGFSANGGKTWNYIAWSGSSAGHTYGAYALTEDVIVVGHSTKWCSNADAVKKIYVTYDGGKTIKKTDYVISGALVACGVKGDNNIVTVGEWRSTDGAKTFKKMNGCTGVFSCDPVTGWLFGVNGGDIVMSKDKGVTWITLYKQNNSNINSVVYNSKTNTVYYTHWAGTLYKLQLDSSKSKAPGGREVAMKGNYVCSIAVDPGNADIMYAVCHADLDYTLQSVWRSLDGGKTWTGIGRQVGDGREGPDGANQANRCYVNANTHELMVFTHCNGVWKIPGPPASYYQ